MFVYQVIVGGCFLKVWNVVGDWVVQVCDVFQDWDFFDFVFNDLIVVWEVDKGVFCVILKLEQCNEKM